MTANSKALSVVIFSTIALSGGGYLTVEESLRRTELMIEQMSAEALIGPRYTSTDHDLLETGDGAMSWSFKELRAHYGDSCTYYRSVRERRSPDYRGELSEDCALVYD